MLRAIVIAASRNRWQPLAVGAPGQGIGYSGIPESLSIEFDMWRDIDNNVDARQLCAL
jgi:hypothetical protein